MSDEAGKRTAIMDMFADRFDAEGVANESLEAWEAREGSQPACSFRLTSQHRSAVFQMNRLFASMFRKSDSGLIMEATQVLDCVGIGKLDRVGACHRVFAGFILTLKLNDASSMTRHNFPAIDEFGPFFTAATGVALSWDRVLQEERDLFLAKAGCSSSPSIDTWLSAFSIRFKIVMKDAYVAGMGGLDNCCKGMTQCLFLLAPESQEYTRRSIAIGIFSLLLSASGLLPVNSLLDPASEQAAWFAASFQQRGSATTTTSQELLLMDKALEVTTASDMKDIRAAAMAVAKVLCAAKASVGCGHTQQHSC